MPRYDYRCPGCGNLQEEDARISEFKDFHPKCSGCGQDCSYEFSPTIIQGILKDGPTGSWPSKGGRFKKYRASQSAKMGSRQQNRYGHLNRDCVPNYQGQLTEDWREAQNMAMKDKDVNSDPLATAATFGTHIKKEAEKKGKSVT